MINQTKLSGVQLTFFIIQTQIGVGILGLPFNVYLKSKQDAWISVLVAGLVVQGVIIILWILARRFPTKSIFEYNQILTGRIFGSFLNVGYIFYGLLVTALVLMYSTKIIKVWVLIFTPKWILMFLLVATAVYLAKEDVLGISNIYVVVTSLIFLLLIISVVVLVTYPVDYRYLFPMAQSGGVNILEGAKEAYFSMLGFELLLILYPHFQQIGGKSILIHVTIANFCVTMVYVFMTIVSIVTFSPVEIEIVPQPVLYFVKSLYLQIVERIDLVFLSLWIVNVITSLTSYLFLSTEGSSFFLRKYKKIKRTVLPFIFGVIALVIALIVKNDQLEIYNKMVIFMSYVFVLIIPVMLLGISLLFRKHEREKQS
ncbi:GerAB/ArcD/ProY family transporter [Bacillus sp. KH172YL63]|uniref:GerAB/ArcD/ProY family transporter n=1 Tax=Bacillus sp. KH172YL63 TaxID=2709784 RepID=UPI0013E4E1F6|nr:endospore germination permease [Bacillus sp. KH172YL63]BCB04319.1 germination protein [Bacillus sp. KH172YL63]